MKEITETTVTHSRFSPRRRSTSKYRPPKNNTDTNNTNNPDDIKNPSTKNSNSNNYDNLNINSGSNNDTDNHYNDNDNNKRGRIRHLSSRVTLSRAMATLGLSAYMLTRWDVRYSFHSIDRSNSCYGSVH